MKEYIEDVINSFLKKIEVHESINNSDFSCIKLDKIESKYRLRKKNETNRMVDYYYRGQKYHLSNEIERVKILDKDFISDEDIEFFKARISIELDKNKVRINVFEFTPQLPFKSVKKGEVKILEIYKILLEKIILEIKEGE